MRIILPSLLRKPLEKALLDRLRADGRPLPDFSLPKGEPALIGPDSVSWQVFKSPIALLLGGITAVILELAEPRIRTGVWEFTTFRSEPMKRMQRTGLAAMMTVYGPRSQAEAMIGHIVKMHERVRGQTPDGVSYHANDPELLRWVHATALFGFLQAYHRFVRPLSEEERNRFYAEGAPVAELYGATGAPTSEKEFQQLFAAMEPKLVPSEILLEFLQIVRRVPVLPLPLRPMTGMFVRAALEMVPASTREKTRIQHLKRLHPLEYRLIKSSASIADRILLHTHPAVQACLRLNLPADYLYHRR